MNHRYCLPLIVALLTVPSGCNRHEASTPSNSTSTVATAVTEPTPTTPARAPTVDASSAAREKRPLIVAFGDSLTAGFGADPGQSYPDFLQEELDSRGYRYRVVNAGVSGNTTKDGVERLKDVVSLKPELVIVEFGGNDGLRGLPNAETAANLDKIISTLTKAGIKVVMGGITLPPNYGQEYIAQFNKMYATVASKYHVPLLPFLLIHVYDEPGSMQEDGIHATGQGNHQVALNLLPLVAPLLLQPVGAP